MTDAKDNNYKKSEMDKESLTLPEIFKKIKQIETSELDSTIKDAEDLLKQRTEELKVLLRNFSKTTLIEMILDGWNNRAKEKFRTYKLRNRGKEKQMMNREYFEKLSEEVYLEMLKNKQKLSLETLTFSLIKKYPDIRWQNNSDPELTEKKLKDVVKLKAIYSKLRKKYIR